MTPWLRQLGSAASMAGFTLLVTVLAVCGLAGLVP